MAAGWAHGDAQQTDLVVIGLGPGGEALATAAAKAGLAVVAVDRRLVGGECPYFGCVPTKMMVRASDVLGEARPGGRAGRRRDHHAELGAGRGAGRRCRPPTTGTTGSRSSGSRRPARPCCTAWPGSTAYAGSWSPPTTARRRSPTRPSKGVVLNPGTRPATPPVDGLADTPFWTNRDAVQVTELPGSLVVLGGGPIGCELAQVFARFGVRVTVVQHGDRLLPANEPEAAALLAEVFAHEGLRVVTGVELDRGVVRRRHLPADPRHGRGADRRQAAGGRRPHAQPRRARAGDRRPRPGGAHHRGGRPDARWVTGSG